MCSTKISGKTGIRCRICTGCGRCQGVERMHILTKRMQPIAVDLRNNRGERLITADVGTTTIAMQLHREDGSVEDSFVTVNPQIAYGADVISRIAAAEKTADMEPEGAICVAEEMQRMVRGVLEKGINRFRARLLEGETLRMVLAANTTMVYLLMGWDVEELGKAPFVATHPDEVEIEIAGVPIHVIPGLSAFVGGDITAGIHASGMLTYAEPVLLVDLGTNGELVLGNREKILACATAAGPAFEGGASRGIWGADMVHFLATLRREGLLDKTGLLKETYFETGVRIGNVCVTQEAVRAIQLAKAAIAAGIEILREKYGCCYDEIQKVILAGGFGYYLNPEDAGDIGLLPPELVEKTVAGGNTALEGALYIGESLFKRMQTEKQGERIEADIRKKEGLSLEIINLAEQKGFEAKYFDNMNL